MSTRRYPISLFNTYSIHIQITSLIFTAGLLGYQGLLKNILFRFGHFLRQKEPKFHPIVTPEKRGPKASPLVPCFVRCPGGMIHAILQSLRQKRLQSLQSQIEHLHFVVSFNFCMSRVESKASRKWHPDSWLRFGT